MLKGDIVENLSKHIWLAVKALCTVAITIVVCVKIFQTPMDVTVDFPTLLSLLLALFAVGLAALFYFKATDTSNTFYDNTYKFTKDIAQLLTKIESGFGERLRHLDEGYSSMRSSLETKAPSPQHEAVRETEQRLEEEKEELNNVLEQRNQIVRQLIEQSQLQENEKEEISKELQSKEQELTEMQDGMARLNKQLFMERLRRRRLAKGQEIHSDGMDTFTRSHVIEQIGAKRVSTVPIKIIVDIFNELAEALPKRYLADMEEEGFYHDGLTPSGAKYLKKLAFEDH